MSDLLPRRLANTARRKSFANCVAAASPKRIHRSSTMTTLPESFVESFTEAVTACSELSRTVGRVIYSATFHVLPESSGSFPNTSHGDAMTASSTRHTEPQTRSESFATSELGQPLPHAAPVMVDIFSDEPLLCPYQRAGVQDGEDCEACQ